MITRCCTNVTVSLQCVATKIRYNVGRIKPYNSNTNVEDISSKNLSDDVNILSLVIYFCVILKLGKIYIIGWSWRHLLT